MSVNSCGVQKIESGQYAGGEQTRAMFTRLLCLNSFFRVEAVSWRTNKVILEIVGTDGIKNVFVIEGNREKSKSTAFISMADLSLYYNGSSIPQDLDAILQEQAKRELDRYNLISLKEIFLADPDLGKPTEKLPAEDLEGHKKFKDKALLSTWGSASSWYNFFATAEIARCQLDSLDFFDTCQFVQHSDIECIYVNPNMPPAQMIEMVYYPWKDYYRDLTLHNTDNRAKWAQHNQENSSEDDGGFQMCMTDFNEYDVIMGKTTDGLIAVLEDVTSKPHDSFILCSCTCVPIVAGEDTESVVKRYQEKSIAPLLYLTCTANSMENLFYNLLVKSRKDVEGDRVEKKKNSFNLVGYADNIAVQELVGVLQGTGLELNTTIFPHLDLETVVNKYPKATLNVVYPNMLWQHLYDQLLLESEIKTIYPVSPYGLKRTKSWLNAILEESPRSGETLQELWSNYFASASERIRELQKQSRAYNLCFVIDGEETFRLIEEAHTWGVPLLPVVEEMGFGVYVYMYAEDREAAFKAATSVNEQFSHPERHVIKAFNTPERLNCLLEDKEINAVYSDYFFDWRLTEVGKSQFTLQLFEMGLQGMIRTMERLLTICQLDFYDRYKKYFKKSHLLKPNQNFIDHCTPIE